MPKSKHASASRKAKAPARKAAAPARKGKPSAKPAVAKPAVKGAGDEAAALFERAIAFASGQFTMDAIMAFKKAVEADAKGALADDALYNIGLCYYQLRLPEEALAYFTRVIEEYPKATIHATPGAQEFGRTAAKAHLGRLHCLLLLGKRDEAQKELDELNKYPDSHVVDAAGKKRTYYELGLEALK